MTRNRSASSRTSSVRSESELTTSYEVPQSIYEAANDEAFLPPQPHNKVLTVNELDQMRMPSSLAHAAADAEVSDVVGGVDAEKLLYNKKTTWQELEIQRRLDIDKLKERREHEHGSVGELHPK